MLEGMNEHFLDLGVGGMSCASCVSRIERVLGQQTGVISVSVNLANETARVVFKEAPSDDALAQIKRAVRAAGYEPRAAASAQTDPEARWMGVSTQAWWVMLAWAFSLPLMGPMVGMLLIAAKAGNVDYSRTNGPLIPMFVAPPDVCSEAGRTVFYGVVQTTSSELATLAGELNKAIGQLKL